MAEERPRSFTAGYAQSALASYRDVFRYHRRGGRRRATEVVRRTREVIELIGGQSNPRILDLGCGGRGGIALPLHTLGFAATGIDYDVVTPQPSIASWRELARRNGFERLVKTIGRQLFFDRPYYQCMSQLLQCELRWEGLDVRTMDARHLGFADNSFSFVFSTAVFEHLADVEAATAEMRRVLREGGKAYIRVHLYPSLSGGHALDWADFTEGSRPETPVPPWDHLRQREFPPHVYLNKMRGDEFIQIFRKYFNVLSESYRTEGEELLTSEIRAELPQWTEKDLTRRNLEVVLSA
jgi:SAM-dependent methyltransferase